MEKVSDKLVVNSGIIELFHSILCNVDECRKLEWLVSLGSQSLSFFHGIPHDSLVSKVHVISRQVKNSTPISIVVGQDS